MKSCLFLFFTTLALAQQPDIKTGPNADLGGALLMPANDEWNRDVSKDEVDPLSDAIIASIGAETGLHEDFGIVWKGQPGGIPYYVVSGDQPKVPVSFEYADESDPGPYPIPPDAHIEGGNVEAPGSSRFGQGEEAQEGRGLQVVDRLRWRLQQPVVNLTVVVSQYGHDRCLRKQCRVDVYQF